MKKAFSSLCFFLLLALSSAAYGETVPYVRGSIGIAMPFDSEMGFDKGGSLDISYDSGLAFSLATGTAINRFRKELEITYQENDLDGAKTHEGRRFDPDGKAWSLALLLNGYYDFVNRTPFTPFLTAGLGIALVEIKDLETRDIDDSFSSENDVVFAYHGGAGIGWGFTERVTLDVAYRYFATLDPDLEIAEMDFSSQNIYFGLRADF